VASGREPRELERLRAWYASHSDAGLEVVGRLQGVKDRVYEAVYPVSNGVVVLETCNRFEVYADVDSPGLAREALLEALGPLASSLRESSGLDAAVRLARIAAGLESAILGEPEILGQVRRAWLDARRRGLSSRLLDMVFHAALRAGRRAREETRIGEGSTGYPSAAVRLAAARLGGLGGLHVLIVGTGEAASAAARIVCSGDYGVPARLVVAGRSAARAARVVSSHCRGLGLAASLSDARLLGPYDLAVVAVSGGPSLAWLPGSARLVVDISVPPAVPAAGNVVGPEAVAEYARRSADARASEIPRVEAIIGEEIDKLIAKLLESRVDPVVAAISRYAEELAAEEALRTARRLGVDGDAAEYLRLALRSYSRKLLHPLLEALRGAARRGEAGPLLEALAAAYTYRGSRRSGVSVGVVSTREA